MQILIDSQDIWRGFIIDRLGISEGGHWLQPCSMIKLRNIHENYWNADTVFILCPSQDAARALAARFTPEQFAAMVDIKEDPKEVDRALGGGDAGTAILRAWWD